MTNASHRKVERIRVLIIHGLFCRYIWEHCDGVKSTLLEHIQEFAKTFCEEDISNSEKDIFAYEPFRRFIENLLSPDPERLDIFKKFLIQKEYLDDVFLEQSATVYVSCDASKLHKDDVTTYEGIYCNEAYADTQTFISSIMIFREARMYKLYAQIQENVYNRGDNETGLEFQCRMDNGAYDNKRVLSGYICNDNDDVIRLKCTEEIYCTTSKKRMLFLNANPILNAGKDAKVIHSDKISAADSDDLHCRVYINMSKKPDILLGNITNLTNRQTNNMVNEDKRFVRSDHIKNTYYYLYRPLRERDCPISQEYNDDLLNAAEGGYPVDMVKALIDGADINVQDEATGWTPLHYVARYSNPLLVAVMLNQQEQLLPILKQLAESENKSVEETELLYTQAQEKIDPMTLSHDHRFASEMCIRSRTAYEHAQNKMFQIVEDVYDDISEIEEAALDKKGLDSSLNVSPISVRAEALGLTPLQQFSHPQPD